MQTPQPDDVPISLRDVGIGATIGAASIMLGRWIWQGGPTPSRLPPLPRDRAGTNA